MFCNFPHRMSGFYRNMSTSLSATGRKVTVLGAGGGIGQPLSLLLKSTPSSISELALYDICNMGMSVDLSHIPTPIKTTGYSGADNLPMALKDSHVVVIPAGVPRKPGMTRDDLFNINAGIVRDLVAACAKTCPNAHLLVISNPVNSTVPIAYEMMKKLGVANPSVFGITTLDVIRAKTFLGEAKGVDPSTISVDVIGGHSGSTIVPLLSLTRPISTDDLSKDEKDKIIHRVQFGGDEVVKAKDGGGSATLSMAFAGNLFIQNFLKALDGKTGIVENTFIKAPEGSTVYPTPYFAGPVELGPNGISRILPIPDLSSDEKAMLEIAVSELKTNIERGIKFVSI